MKLSVIIPIYNVENYIQKCFNLLVENNKLNDFEVIFINDGSTDNSFEIIKEIERNNNFVKVISQENQGLSGARNTGITHSQGKYFMFLDPDDWLNIDTIVNLLEIAIKNNLDLINFGLEYFNEKYVSTGLMNKHSLEYEKIITGKTALLDGYQPSSACLFLYKTNFILSNNFIFYLGIVQEDVEFTNRILLFAQKVYFSNKTAYNYYRHSGTISMAIDITKKQKYLFDAIKVAQLMRESKKNQEKNIVVAIEKNYNSVVWNLIFRFITKPKEVDYQFKKHCIESLKNENLYPIKGSIKTRFQKISTFFFNIEFLLKLILKYR